MRKFAIFTPMLLLGACGSVDAGQIGLWNRFGEVSNTTVEPGMHVYNIFTTSLETMNIQSQPIQGTASIYTKDLQTALAKFTVTISLKPSYAVKMRKTVGLEWSDKLVPPIAYSTIKDIFGQFNAAEAVSKRPVMEAEMLRVLRQRLLVRGITVEDFKLTNIDYSDEFENAVEAAQVATQRAVAAKNHTVEVEEQAKQRVITANAEAEAIKAQANAITSNPAIVQMRAIEKWNGVMPQNMYGGAPLPFVQAR